MWGEHCNKKNKGMTGFCSGKCHNPTNLFNCECNSFLKRLLGTISSSEPIYPDGDSKLTWDVRANKFYLIFTIC